LNATDLTVINKFFYEQTDSTNIRAKEFACSKKNENPQEEKNLLPIKAIFVANSQTAGKGRLGRSFFSPKDCGIYLSIIFETDFLEYENDVTLITPKVAVSVCKTLEKFGCKDCKIKWVNDIFINEKKVCGILTEGILSNSQKGKINPAIIGIGINLQEDKKGFPKELSKIATSANIKFELREEIINQLLLEILQDLKNENHFSVMSEYKNRSNLIGKTVNVIENTFSGQSYQAQVVDISDKGHLLVKKKLQNSFEENLTEIFTGEVSIKFWIKKLI
jgi:BirA family biotin operon repressor/biotin-[acetyl-CoA-carboxylase] ligase